MALEWNKAEDLAVFYRYSGGVWTRYLYYQTDDGIDFFNDSIAVGDALYFINCGYPSNSSHAHKFQGLRLVVDVAVSATGYSYVWEYYSYTSKSWVSLPGLSDPSNGLQNTGTHDITWDMPTDWQTLNRPCNNDYWSSGYSVRLRVTAVTASVEGGKHGTTTMKQFNYAYHIGDGNEYTPEDIYNFDVSLGNGLVEKTNDGLYYLINANVIVGNGKLTVPFKTRLTIGKEPRTGFESFEIIVRDNGELELDGSFLKWNNGFAYGQYLYWNGKITMKNAARLWRYGYGYVGCTIAGELDIEDSQMTLTDTSALYFHGNARGQVRRSNMACYNFYVYTGKVTWEDVKQTTNADRSSNYQLLGGTSVLYARFKGFDFKNSIILNATQGMEFWAINPENFSPTKIALGSTYGRNSNYIFIGYELSIKVIDSAGNPIERARVYLRDTNNHTGWLHNWLETDGYTIYGLYNKDDTSGYFRRYSDPTYSSGVYQKPDWVEVGDILRVRGEYIKITGLSGGGQVIFTCDRNQTYRGYTSLGLGGFNTAPLYTEEDYLETNSNGEVKFSGEFGDFTPVVIANIYSEDQDDTRKDRSYNPYRIRVEKVGYKPYEMITNITKPTSLVIALEKSKVYTDLEVLA